VYTIDKLGVRYRHLLVHDADVATFTPLGGGWAKDRRTAYCHGARVDDADARSFAAIDDLYARDRKHVFGGTRILDEEVDVVTFRAWTDGYATDARGVYYAELRLGWLVACWRVENADPATLRTLGHGWAADRRRVYASGMAAATLRPARTVALTRRFALDGRAVCGSTFAIDAADAATFRALSTSYARDAKHIYYADERWHLVSSPLHMNVAVPSVVERATFRPIGSHFAVDAKRLYWMHDVVVDVEPGTARALSRHFVCTADRVHYFYAGIHRSRTEGKRYLGMESIVLDAADPTTFRDLGELYGADAKRAYYHSTPIALRGSARRFEVLGANVARDDVAVYFQHEAIDGADPATFAIISPGGLARSGAKWFRLIDTDHGSCALPITKAEAERVLAGEDDELGGEDDDY